MSYNKRNEMGASSDALEAQNRLQNAMRDMVDELDRTRLRKIQLQMHLCAAKCCQDEKSSLEVTQQCVEACSAPVHAAHDYVQNELQQFQDRMQRCVLDCQDKTKDKMSPNSSESELDMFKRDFEACACKCVDEHLKLIPGIMKKMQKVLESKPFTKN